MTNIKQGTHLNILLADDDSDDCFFFQEALKESSISTTLTVVHDGEQLMNLLTSETGTLPHVLFLDLNMPRKNGFECLAEIKMHHALKELPVIIYSTSFHKKIATVLYEHGATYYISKPYEISKLKSAVHKAILLIAEECFQQPNKETFLLTEEKKNSKSFLWFADFFNLADSVEPELIVSII